MLMEKTWRTEAIVRLFLSVIVCFFAGSFLVAALQYWTAHSRGNAPLYLLVTGSLCCLGVTLAMLRKPWQLENALGRLVMVLVCFYVGLMLGAWASKFAGAIRPSVGQMIVSALSLQGAVLVLIGPFLREHQVGWTEAFGLKNRWAVAVLMGLAVGCIFLPLGWLLQGASSELMMRLHLRPEQQQVVTTLQTDHAAAGRMVFGLVSIVLVPPAEETFFRGVLYPWIKQAGYPRLALWGTSLVFAAIHANLVSFVPLAVFALALTQLYERTGNLLAPISAHALFNAANLARLYLVERALN